MRLNGTKITSQIMSIIYTFIYHYTGLEETIIKFLLHATVILYILNSKLLLTNKTFTYSITVFSQEKKYNIFSQLNINDLQNFKNELITI